MTIFRVGQRVRIKWSDGWPELAGMEATITGGPERCENEWLGEWFGYPVDIRFDFWPKAEQLEPLSDSNTLVSWESMRDLWVPEHLRVAA